MSEYKYMQFPVSLLRDLTVNKFEAIDKMIVCGLYRFASLNVPTPEAVARQLAYDMYRDKLTGELDEYIVEFIRADQLTFNENYRGFSGFGMFEPEDEISELQTLFDVDDTFYQLAIEHYQIHAVFEAGKVLGITVGNPAQSYRIGKEICEANVGTPFAMVKKDKCFEFRDDEKKEFDLIMFAANAAVNSIVGKKLYCKTNKGHIIARMFGYASIKQLPKRLPADIAPLFEKYSTRHHWEKLRDHLKVDWHWVLCPGNKGNYVSQWNKDKPYKFVESELKKIIAANSFKNKLKKLTGGQ